MHRRFTEKSVKNRTSGVVVIELVSSMARGETITGNWKVNLCCRRRTVKQEGSSSRVETGETEEVEAAASTASASTLAGISDCGRRLLNGRLTRGAPITLSRGCYNTPCPRCAVLVLGYKFFSLLITRLGNFSAPEEIHRRGAFSMTLLRLYNKVQT